MSAPPYARNRKVFRGGGPPQQPRWTTNSSRRRSADETYLSSASVSLEGSRSGQDTASETKHGAGGSGVQFCRRGGGDTCFASAQT